MRSYFVGIAEVHEVPKVAVVIDVMRAFTVAAWAFARGAERIVFAETLDSARDLKARHPDWLALQDGAPLPGFDLVNSPALLRSLDLAGRTIVQKTTAGTVGALSVADAEVVLCASFVVAEATVGFLLDQRPDEVTFVVTGADGKAEEDLACAEYIAKRTAVPDLDAAPYIERARNSTAAGNLAEGVRRGYRGIHPDDVDLCLNLNRFPFVMAATKEHSHMVLRPTHLAPTSSPLIRAGSKQPASVVLCRAMRGLAPQVICCGPSGTTQSLGVAAGDDSGEVAEIEVVGTEVVVGADADERVEEILGEGQGMRFREDRVDLAFYASLGHATQVLVGLDPQIGRPHLNTELFGQEDRAHNGATSHVEHPHAGLERHEIGQGLRLPPGFGPILPSTIHRAEYPADHG